jgi:hypothetical protein
MFRILCCALVLGGIFVPLGKAYSQPPAAPPPPPPVPVYAPVVRDWSRAYALTPLEHRRLRAYGLKDVEIYLLAYASVVTRHNIDELCQLYLVHAPASQQAEYLGLSLPWLTNTDYGLAEVLKLYPEWNTPAWLAAVDRGDYWYVHVPPSQAPPPTK